MAATVGGFQPLPQPYTAVYEGSNPGNQYPQYHQNPYNGQFYQIERFSRPVRELLNYSVRLSNSYLNREIYLNDSYNHCCDQTDVYVTPQVVIIRERYRTYNPWTRFHGNFIMIYGTGNSNRHGDANEALARLAFAIIGALAITAGSYIINKNLDLVRQNNEDTNYLDGLERQYNYSYEVNGHNEARAWRQYFKDDWMAQPHANAVENIIEADRILLDHTRRNAAFGLAMGISLIATGIITIIGAAIAAEALMVGGAIGIVTTLALISLKGLHNKFNDVEGRCARNIQENIEYMHGTIVPFVVTPSMPHYQAEMYTAYENIPYSNVETREFAVPTQTFDPAQPPAK